MTLTKATGAVCGSLLVFLLGSWAAEEIYSVGGGHGDHHVQGYVIDTGEDETEEAEDTGPDIPALFASAEASKGERVFNQCRACHNLEDGENGVGPHLYGVVSREIGSVDGYNYSGALSEAADVWTAENLFAFLENPAGWAPGTSMGYSGLSKPEDRANLIVYLDQTDGTDDIEITAASAEAPAEEAPAEDAASAEETSMEADATEEAAMDEGATEESTTDAAATEEAATEGEGSEEVAAADMSSEEDMQDTADTAAEDGTSEQAAADDAATEASTEQASAEDAQAEEMASEDAASDDAGDQSGFAAMVASADVEAGKTVFRQCSACHSVEDGRNMVGPSMHGVVGREIASVDGFRYSSALSGLDGEWTVEELSAWIENPREYAPGNRMGYPGLKDEQDRANVIAYMDSLDD